MQKVKVCHVSSAHSVHDDRIFFKECSSLADDFDVHLIAIGEKDEVLNNVQIHALPKSSSRFNRFFLLQIKILIQAFKINAKVYHFHDPDLIIFGLIQKMLGKKVIYDMHELVYFQINDKEWLGNGWIKKMISSIYLMFEKMGVRFFDRIIIAEDGYWNYINKNYKKQIYKFIAIRNFSIYQLIKQTEPNISIKNSNKRIIVYAGGLSKIRGIKEIIDAIQTIENITFLTLGQWENDDYKKQCELADLNYKMNYIGLVKMDKVYSYLKVADIGIANLYHKPNYLTSLPIKAFEYMASGIPIIMSDFPYWIETFSQCALFVNPLDANDIKDKIELLLSDKQLSSKLADAGNKLVIEKYTWEAESKLLVKHYQQLV
jgi:glycosyltransferase involved in cell wall biosynthesis